MPTVHNVLCPSGRPDPCSSSPCLNGGTCFHYIGKYKCECTEDFFGRHCEVNMSLTHASTDTGCGDPPPVEHADVLFSKTTPGSMAVYICRPGFLPVPRATQSICGLQGAWSQPPVCEEMDECRSQPCLNGGTCRDQVGSFSCECLKASLETAVKQCSRDTCKNGGTCEDESGSYVCHCPAGFKGSTVRKKYKATPPKEQDVCDSSPCLNGGVCRSYRRNYLCLCKEGFFGDLCQMLEDPCVLNPCGNRGLCTSDKRGNYHCVCNVGHTGKDCDKGTSVTVTKVRVCNVGHTGKDCDKGTSVSVGHAGKDCDKVRVCNMGHTGKTVTKVRVCNVGHTGKDCDKGTSVPAASLRPAGGPCGGDEVELRWDPPEPSQSLVSGFAVKYAPLGRGSRKTDLLERRHSHVMRGLQPGLLYNISTISLKHNINNSDYSRPATRSYEPVRNYFVPR
ncbi:hypothetical protein WMY93_023835 [Mugilogobius chulae]|uniref:Sushi, nidogen and EGF-like domain-containing protein 1 n=1 Tax=Mugilogobius chulae TaxID=88201 RepID=A0AAW0NHK4_9GOBI